MGSKKKAVPTAQKKDEMGDHMAAINRGYALMALDRPEEAIECFGKALEIKPDYREGWVIKAVALAMLKKFKEAISAIDEAIKINPGCPEVWNIKGLCLGYMEMYDEADDAFYEAVKIKPDYANAWYNRGCNYGNNKNHKEAICAFDKALNIDPDNAEVLFKKATSHVYRGNYLEAIAARNKAKGRQDRRQLRINGIDHCLSFQYWEAIECFCRYLGNDTDWGVIDLIEVVDSVMQGFLDLSESDIMTLSRKPKPLYIEWMAIHCTLNHRYDKAIEQIQKAKELRYGKKQ